MLPEAELVALLARYGLTVSTAESCTGGLIAKRLTDVPGASAVFPGGVVSYSEGIKERLLGVPHETLLQYTAVSAQVASAMAIRVKKLLNTDFSLSATGYAGPGGENVGLVYIAVAYGDTATVKKLQLSGDRETIRALAATEAINLLLSSLHML